MAPHGRVLYVMASAANAKRKRNVGKSVVTPTTLLGPLATAVVGNATTNNNAVTPHTPQIVSTSERPRGDTRSSGRTLDGFMLLDCCRVDFPDEVTQAVLSGMRINNVVAEDLLFFTNLARLDMSDNDAPFEAFGSLPALAEMDFQCNALECIILGNGFLNLEVLNLSFNCLTSKDVEELSGLLRIRELYLANNWIRSLPPIMDRFTRLETLSLERNNITGDEIFSFLAMVPRLRNLNLSHNKLTHFPESALVVSEKRGAGFYNLLYLNLAHNAITDEAHVLYASELHSLRKLVLYGNPIAHNAVYSHDKSKLVYDPVPTITQRIADGNLPLTVIVAYPETKKKRNAMSYENVDIFKMLPNEVPLQSPFRTRATNFMIPGEDNNDGSNGGGSNQNSARKSHTDLSENTVYHVDNTDSTFLTGVGIEDVLGSIKELPAIPTAVVTRSLALTKHVDPLRARAALNALRYQLEHPLTSHDDSEVTPPHAFRPTLAQTLRQRPRKHYEPRKHNDQVIFTTAVVRNSKS
ncbi:TPA: hypothetical protein N0F65_012150 [Lagenidium giganteum]|uniref:Uncharacterized protein n=1 Tax=Lagenidium giganteum TaxID=4803 RepID=A0AAV2YXH5_9STRA|nr:TPA: hypothetical protein N0F65_012150 [Lagenidium giganteum]